MNKLKNFRQRLSLQNQNLSKNKLKEVLDDDDNKKEEKKEITEEEEDEDVLKNFSQQEKKRKKEEEAKKYLKPILEEDDPLNYFDKKKSKEAEDKDPLLFLKESEEIYIDDLPKTKGILISEEISEKTLSEKIRNDEIPDEIVIEKKNESSQLTHEERKKKMEKRFNTSLRLSQRKGLEQRAKDKLMQRIQNYKNTVNAGDTIKNTEKPNENKNIGNSGNTLLSAEEQVTNINNNNTVKVKKEVDLSSFMKKKNEN